QRPDHTVAVPNLLSLTRDRAADQLASAGLRLGKEHHEHVDAPLGTVYQSDPPGGSLQTRGTQVDIWVSDGPATVTVPSDLVGKTKDDASRALTALGLKPHVTLQASDQPADVVVETDPPPGATVDAGAQVELHVSCGDPDTC